MSQSSIDNNDIKIFLMDKPALNSLIDGCQFDDTMINNAIINVTDAFNVAVPVSNIFYTASTFPSRYLLLMGVAGYLLKSAAIGDARNMFTYSADGIQVSDRDKAQIYLSMGREFWTEFQNITTNIKTNQNIAQCFGNYSSEYIFRLYS